MNESSVPKYLYKYKSLASAEQMGFAYRLLVHNEVKFSTPREFNDPFEFYCQVIRPRTSEDFQKYVEYVVENYKRDPEEVRNTLNTPDCMSRFGQGLVETARERVRVFSVAQHFSEPSMWAYYADEHKGICVEFCNDVLFSDPYKVDYPENNRPPVLEIQRIKNEDSHRSITCTKACSWDHEKEWCYIEHHRGPPPQPHLIVLPDDMITGVILGERIENWKRDLVDHWLTLRKRSYRLWEATSKDGAYEIERHLIRECK